MTNFYNQYGGNYNPNHIAGIPYNPAPNPQQQPQNNGFGLLGKINEFAKTVQNPQQQVEELLKSGQMTQEQFQQYAQIAKMLTNNR